MNILLTNLLKNRYCVTTALAVTITFTIWSPVLASDPENSSSQYSRHQTGLTSTTVECLVVEAGTPDNPSATVGLEWEGQIEEAFLSLAVAGSEDEHSIYINGQLAGQVPARPGGQSCQPGIPVPSYLTTDIIPIPVEMLTQGENTITLTNDANINDGWTAGNLYLEIYGDLSLPSVSPMEKSTSLASSGLEATAVTTGSEVLISSYDGSSHTIWYQVPNGYTGSSPVPLVVGAHGWGGTGEDVINAPLATEANERGWLLVAPNTHGTYYLDGKRSMAWPGAQHDILDAVEYMQDYYAVDPTRIYITGGSMGGQTTAMMAMKYPDVFAAAAGWKPFTDVTDWYNNELVSAPAMQWHIRNETGGAPGGSVDFEYQRRSPMAMPQNGRYVPLKIWHDVDDTFVAVYHSHDLRDAINTLNPVTPVTLIEVPSDEIDCGDTKQHCYTPPMDDVFDFLANFTLSAQPLSRLIIRTDESKPYFWLNVVQPGSDHWTEVEATYNLTNKTVTATISDTQSLILAFNLGSAPILGRANISQSGMGLPATTYLINGGGNYALANYASGYLTTTLSTTGQFSLTISAITAEILANPSTIVTETVTSDLTATVKDQLNNPVPDGTTAVFSTTKGTFSNGSSIYVTTITGGQGQSTARLTTDGPAQITFSIESIEASTSIGNASTYLPIVIKN